VTILRSTLIACAVGVAAAGVGLGAGFVVPAGAAVPAVHPVLFAAAPAGASKPDDITVLNGVLYTAYQNNAGKDGTPAGSVSQVVALNSHGAVTAAWSIAGRVDGLTADPGRGVVYATINEDLNSRLAVITPGNATPKAYTYSPSPAQTGTEKPRATNGGTDAVSVGSDGTLYVAHSNPEPALRAPNNAAAVFKMTLAGTTATLTGLFGVNDTAPMVNPAAGGPARAPLHLTDPDSNRIIASASGDTLIQVAQGDSRIVFASHLNSATPTLKQLTLHNAGNATGAAVTPQLDDIAQVTGPGTLYAVDQKAGTIVSIDTAAITAGSYIVSQPAPSTGDFANTADLGVLDIQTGIVTHLHSGLTSPKGLLFIPAATPHPTPSSSAPGGGVPTAVPAGSGGQAASTSATTVRLQLATGIAGIVVIAAAAAGLTRRRTQH